LEELERGIHPHLRHGNRVTALFPRADDRAGTERVGAEEWAAKLGTISYEIVCGISARVPRLYVTADGR
jgi:alanine racemase